MDKTVKHAHWCQSVGMMGTFFGIVYGMMSLDTDELFKSVEGMISGMSLAFYNILRNDVYAHNLLLH